VPTAGLRRQLDAARHHVHAHKWLRRSLIALAILVGLAVVIRLILDPIASRYTRKALDDAKGVSGDFLRVHVTLLPPGYEIRRLKVVQEPGGDAKNPLFYVDTARVGLDWRALFHGDLAASLTLEQPKLTILRKPAKKKETKEEPAGIPDLRPALQKVLPARVDRIDVVDGEVVLRDLTLDRHPEFWLHDIAATVRNIATRRELAEGKQVTLALQGKLGTSGKVAVDLAADPFAAPLKFDGELALRDWRLAELYALTAAAADLQTPEGTIDVFAKFKGRKGAISGGVKPILKNVKVRPVGDDFGDKVKAWLADKGVKLFSHDGSQGREAGTVIPIQGRLDDPDVQLWPTILGVLRNAFVEGITGGFNHLPPPTAEEKQGVLTQAKNALSKDAGPPKAQPTKQKAPSKDAKTGAKE
jgi:hypothetical protein